MRRNPIPCAALVSLARFGLIRCLKVGMRSGSACPYPGEPVYRAVREWPWFPDVDRPIGHAAGTAASSSRT